MPSEAILLYEQQGNSSGIHLPEHRMTAPASQLQWYLARDGQQYGPLSDAELSKFIELGHLQPSDLLWREGFPDWRPALVVFPQRPPAATRRPAPTTPAARRPPPDYGRDPGATHRIDDRPPVRARVRPTAPAADEPNDRGARSAGGKVRKALLSAILIGALGTAVWLGYPHRAQLMEFVTSLGSGGIADRKSLEAPPFAGFKGNAQAIDVAMQAAAVWRVVKREFPDWYAQRLTEIETLASAGSNDAAIGQHLARALIALRRQQVDNALSAQIPRLKMVAQAFLDNITQLRRTGGVEACYAFISQGESNPIIVGLLQGSEHTVLLQSQMVAIIEAIAEGRKTPRVYPQPRQSDYDILAADLTKRGWTKPDLQMFSDERALARAGPEKVCQLVHDWFAAQLALTDADVQQRLLVDSLRPVVAG